MNNLIISVFENKIFFEVLAELQLFSKYKIKLYKNINLYKKDLSNSGELLVFFNTNTKKENKNYETIIKNNLPLIVINKFKHLKNSLNPKFVDQLILPFSILDFEKKIVSLLARYKFNKSSLINLKEYTIDKNERKIRKNNQELQLTEKEIDFLILFSEYDVPLNRNFVLNKVWKYSAESDTHTVETHIHRLRKKIFEKFNDSNFIKNNEEGYYI